MPRRSGMLFVLCAPAWVFVFFCLLLLFLAKIHSSLVQVLTSRPLVYLPTAFVLMAPFCWFFAAWPLFKRWRKYGEKDTYAWVVVLTSGLVMLASWLVLGHFAHR